jgi:5-hydroxyisourate hydrolase-like protein (transthyretin family)
VSFSDLSRLARRRSLALGVFATTSSLLVFVLLLKAQIIHGSIMASTSPQAILDPQKAPVVAGRISGHVYRADTGEPLAKTQVGLLPITKSPINVTGTKRSTVTDAEGLYSFDQVSPGTYTVAAKHSGFIQFYFEGAISPLDAQILTVNVGDNLSKIDLRLLPAGVISGTLLDEDNQPLEGAPIEPVRLRYFRGGRQLELPFRTATTDDLGNFRISGLPPGNYFVRTETAAKNAESSDQVFRLAYYPGTSSIESAQRIKITPGSEISGLRFSVAKQKVYSISGKIIDATGNPGERRYIARAGRVAGSEETQVPEPSADGSFKMQGVPSGEYLFWASVLHIGADSRRSGPGHASEGFAIVHVAQSDARVNIQVIPDVELTGKVVAENSAGQPVAGVVIALWPELPVLGTGPNMLNGETDRNGDFKIQYLTGGAYNFSTFGDSGMYLKQAVCSGKDYTLLPLTIESGANIGDCTITMGTDAGLLKGRVMDDEKPVRDMTVVAIPQERSLRHLERFTITGKTNASGDYQLLNIIPGEYLLFAVPPDDANTYFDIDFADRNQRDAERVTIKPNEIKTIQLKPTTPQ